MKTIEEMGQLARDTWNAYWNRDGFVLGSVASERELEAFTEVAKAVITALEDGVAWAAEDDSS